MSVAAVILPASKTPLKMMGGPCKKKQRLSYSVMFKLAAVCYSETYGNRATARFLGVNEKQIRDWKSKKHHLIHCDSQAKRLKGAARQREEKILLTNENSRFKTNASCDKDLTGYSCCHFTRNDVEFWPYAFGISKQNLQAAPFYEDLHQHEGSNLVSGNSKSAKKCLEADKELDFHERFSCALALLDLKASCS